MVISVAESLRMVNPDLLVTSEYTRAIESARIIAQHTGLTPVTNGLFYEIVRPSKFYSTSIFSLETIWFVITSIFKRGDYKWRYGDAENVFDVSNRAQRALAYIESLRGKHNSVLIVSHTVFINIMIAYMCKKRMLDIRDLLFMFLHVGRMHNAGVIHVEYVGNGASNTCNWRIVKNGT
jgi:broad specificity phosphatase PhoE